MSDDEAMEIEEEIYDTASTKKRAAKRKPKKRLKKRSRLGDSSHELDKKRRKLHLRAMDSDYVIREAGDGGEEEDDMDIDLDEISDLFAEDGEE